LVLVDAMLLKFVEAKALFASNSTLPVAACRKGELIIERFWANMIAKTAVKNIIVNSFLASVLPDAIAICPARDASVFAHSVFTCGSGKRNFIAKYVASTAVENVILDVLLTPI